MSEARALELEAQATAADKEAFDSFERCDTDGFLSQWALGLTAQEKRAQARILENGGKSEFPALLDLEGNLVPAKLIDTRYGRKFAVFASTEDALAYGSNIIEWVNPFVRPKTLEVKGYRLGRVLAKAKADIAGSGTGLAGAASCHVVVVRTDGGFDPDAEITDDGTEEES
jgi:hypothetical protein